MKLLVVLPTYNEAPNIEILVRAILAVHADASVLVVDDSSPDGTGNIADMLAKEFPARVIVKHRPAKSGRGSAVVYGFEVAMVNGYDFVMEMDADLSHDPKIIPSFIDKANATGADLVVGSRHILGGETIGWNRRRKLLSWCAQTYTKIVLGTPTTDHSNGFRLYRVAMLGKLDFSSFANAGYVRQTLMEYVIYKRGFKIAEVPCIFVDRRFGSSKMGVNEMLGGLWAIAKMRL